MRLDMHYILLNALLAFLAKVNGESSDFSIPKQLIKEDDICICPAIYQPICGSNGKTYGNSCSLDCTRKKNPYVFGLCKGECPCCKEPFYNDPLTFQEESGFWGWDQKTGTHHQVLPQQKQKDYGEQTNTTDQCTERLPVPDCNCIQLYDPVCGSDGITYGNGCELACQTRVKSCLGQACAGERPCCSGPCTK